MKVHDGRVNAVLAVGSSIWSASSDHSIHIWFPLAEKGSTEQIRLEGHQGQVLAMIQWDQHVVSAGEDKQIVQWDPSKVCIIINIAVNPII
jgi:WD40 repeat protein